MQIQVPHSRLAAFCQRWQIEQMALFGSVLRKDFAPESDVDVLVRFAHHAHWTLFDLMEMQDELAGIFQRPVDLLEWKAVEQSENYIRRKAILNSAQVIYGA